MTEPQTDLTATADTCKCGALLAEKIGEIPDQGPLYLCGNGHQVLGLSQDEDQLTEDDITAFLAGIDVADQASIDATRKAATPAATGMQRQGDLIVIPTSTLKVKPQTGPITPLDGHVTALKGTDNEHVLAATGNVTWAAAPAGSADLGVLTVGPGAVATLSHTGHHGELRINRGEYVLRRQQAVSAPAAVPAVVAPVTRQAWVPQDAPRPRSRRWVVD